MQITDFVYAGNWPMNKDIFNDADFEGAFVSDRDIQVGPVAEPETAESSATSAINGQPAAGNPSASEAVIEPTSNASAEILHPIASSSNSLAFSCEGKMVRESSPSVHLLYFAMSLNILVLFKDALE